MDKIIKEEIMKLKKLSDRQLIMKALGDVLGDINELKQGVPSAYRNMPSYEELQKELNRRIGE